MIRYLAAVLLLASPVFAGDDDTLLQTELDNVAELLSLDKPNLAQLHLDIIRKEFPKSEKDICYYQGHIAFRLADYKAAAKNLERLLELGATGARENEARKFIALSCIRTKEFARAAEMLANIQAFGGKDSWYAAACVELAETQAEAVSYKPAKTRVELKTDTVKVLTAFAAKFPDHEQMPWIRFFIAEYEYDKLVALLYQLGKMKDEASPEVLEEKNRSIIVQLHQSREIYEAIQKAAPKHPVMGRVEPRLRYLMLIVDKMKNGESFLPEDP